MLGRAGWRAIRRDDDVHGQPGQVGGQSRVPLVLPLAPADLQGDRLPLDVAQVPQPLPEDIKNFVEIGHQGS